MANHRHHLCVAGEAEELFPEIDGSSAAIRLLKEHMRRVGRDPDITVLILGESGTGKERVAHAIHRVSPRRAAPFVVVNCAGLAPTLVEDELFGHMRGAFTGASDDRAGPFERASGGTVFLDEVGDLTPDLQMKLLRALQQRTVQRLGGRQETAFDVRVVAATNVDLAEARKQGRFREDLYYRLNVYPLTVPPVRERHGDVRRLVRSILERFSQRRQRQELTLDTNVLEVFDRYSWPGNVRELENIVECMIVAADGQRVLTLAHLPERFAAEDRRTMAERARRTLPARAEALAALERNGFTIVRAAADLGISRHQLDRLVRRYQISAPGGRGSSLRHA